MLKTIKKLILLMSDKVANSVSCIIVEIEL